jgi:hypothetical protein
MAYALLEQLEQQAMLLEYKKLQDYRHENVEDQLKFWGDTKTSEYIDPKNGFYWIYDKGELVLFSTQNESYSIVVASGLWKDVASKKLSGYDAIRKARKKDDRDLWNHLGGLVNYADKTITISKESAGKGSRMRVINDVKNFQDALKDLKRFKVTDDFKVKNTNKPYNAATVGEILKMKDGIHAIMNEKHPIMYHGTSQKKWDEFISKKGLQPGKYEEVYVDLIKGYSEHNVYLAIDQKTAEFYGKRQAKKDGSDKYVVIEVKVPDPAKILADDAMVAWSINTGKKMTDPQMHAATKEGVKTNSSVAYKGSIRLSFLKIIATKKA